MPKRAAWVASVGTLAAALLLAASAGAAVQTDITVEATAALTPVSFPLADAEGDTCVPASGSTFPVGATPVTCNAMAYGFTVTVTDNTPPTITVPAPIVAAATDSNGAQVDYTATAFDLVDGPVLPTCAPASGSEFGFGTTTVTCNAVDSHGNPSTPATFSVTVVDTPPVITVPAPPIVAQATDSSGASVGYTVTASDVVDGSDPVTCAPVSGSVFGFGPTTVTCNAVDSQGGASQATFPVTVVDTTPPVITVPAPIVKEATGPSGAPVAFTATASDAVDGSDPVTCAPASGSVFALGSTTVTCNAEDSHHNASPPATFSVTVADTTPPVITVPAPIIVQADSSSGAVVAYGVTAVDLVDGPVAAACLPASGSLFVVGTTTVTCNAKDAKNNAAAPKSFTVKVTAPPVVPGPPGTPPPPTTTVPAPLLPPTLKPQPVSNFTAAPGDRRVLVSWKLPAGAGLHVELQRTTGGGSPKTIYVGAALSFADTHLQNGSTYTYSIVVVDAAGNRSNSLSEKASPKAVALVAPPAGARLTSAPTLVWVPTRKATYYNVQLYRGGRKILSIWPGSNRLALKRHWIFGGRAFTLSPGQYNWYVWPGFGPHRAQKYGSPLGNSMFQLTG
jgi:hypothetical protein